jgi:hypothetical protein
MASVFRTDEDLLFDIYDSIFLSVLLDHFCVILDDHYISPVNNKF